MNNKQVAVFYGDDASPEVMKPTVDLLRSMNLGIDFIEPLVGTAAKDATGTLFPEEAKVPSCLFQVPSNARVEFCKSSEPPVEVKLS